MFHVTSHRPKEDGICDECGTPLLQRDDDRPEVIQKRLAVYHRQTAPVATFYQKQKKLGNLDAAQGFDEVSQSLHQILESRP